MVRDGFENCKDIVEVTVSEGVTRISDAVNCDIESLM